jgi:hypothetical protein
MAALLVVTGLVAVTVGVAVARQCLREAHRAYQKTASFSTATLEGWGSWFLGGFSGLAMGLRGLYALAACSAWTLAGACLIGIGVRLFTSA